jgi:hypothetical protein
VRFPYRAFRVRGAPSNAPEEVCFRPSILARVVGLSKDAVLYGLLDTGAELTLFDSSYVDLLDVHIKPGDYETLRSVSGHRFRVYFGIVDIELANRSRITAYRWHARVGFTNRPSGEGAIFGHEGFLEYFCASFHGPKRHVNLVPRAALPLPCMPGGAD